MDDAITYYTISKISVSDHVREHVESFEFLSLSLPSMLACQ